jgi:Trp operon repressor
MGGRMRRIAKKTNMIQREWQFKNLVNIFCGAENKKEIEALLQTLLSPSEKYAIAQRADIIRILKTGAKYYEIEGKFGISSNTIASTMERYYKYGDLNRDFNEVFKKYKIEPVPKIDLSSKPMTGLGIGVRALRHEEEKFQKKRDKKANEKAIGEAKTMREKRAE